MIDRTRRRTVAATGCALSGALAGCTGAFFGSDDDAEPDDDGPNDAESDDKDADPLADAVADGAGVNYLAFIDDGATVDENRRRITYSDPETEFSLFALSDGTFASTDTLQVRRDLSTDVMTAFIAPEFDDGVFTYHVFANDPFVEYADWNALTFENRESTGERRITFDELHDDVSHFAVTPERETNNVVVTDTDRETYEDPESEPTIVGISRGRRTEREGVPDVSFTFEYGTETDPTVELTHTGGDSLEGDRIAIHLDGRSISDPFAVESVTTDETAVIDDVPEGSRLFVIYHDGDGNGYLLASATVWR
ncbi:type IV pilin N-terminal domain-containing protein [Natrinema salaciae]|uniref:Uncharacterized protein n=1 Tax=Natrinema salaciae TaxID=1186196 RepID=A0A1H9S3E7_9EURY|nr:type IV pilin N-terminal domain-containing protein [Natrinema salaciae]SER79586.1 hypothetical protein SAMN04489841_4568 [Natrinema salaciae]